jgi:hypothetical protein
VRDSINQEKKRSVELADVFLRDGEAYRQKHGVSIAQNKVMKAISSCRTSVLGGHVSSCTHCGALEVQYNSCRNRHCPKCQTVKQLRWLEGRKTELLPIEYFHVVFTIPHELNGLAGYNQSILYNLLFKAAWMAIRTLGLDPKRLDGQMGMLSVLHTWGQNLSQHIHLHCIIPGGALCEGADGPKWHSCKPGFLFPVKVMSRLYGRIFLNLLQEAYTNNALSFKGAIADLGSPKAFSKLMAGLKSKSWNVYAKAPFNGAIGGLEYIARYISKIAIGNERILSCENGEVRFKWRDYADHNASKVMTLASDEFIRRFLQHVLPNGLVRIRSFGFWANACKVKNLKLIRSVLPQAEEEPSAEAIKTETEPALELIERITGVDVLRCKHCKIGRLERIGSIPSFRQSLNYLDTS